MVPQTRHEGELEIALPIGARRHTQLLTLPLVVLFGAVVGGFGLGALNYAIIEIATK
jgi:hypothetical protein